MRKAFLLCILIGYIFAQNLYFNAFNNIKKAKTLINKNPKEAQMLFIEAYTYLKTIVNKSIKEEKPNTNAINLLGELYLNGWGVDKNETLAIKLFCIAASYGNQKAQKILKKLNKTCPTKINLKEIKQ